MTDQFELTKRLETEADLIKQRFSHRGVLIGAHKRLHDLLREAAEAISEVPHLNDVEFKLNPGEEGWVEKPNGEKLGYRKIRPD